MGEVRFSFDARGIYMAGGRETLVCWSRNRWEKSGVGASYLRFFSNHFLAYLTAFFVLSFVGGRKHEKVTTGVAAWRRRYFVRLSKRVITVAVAALLFFASSA